MEMGGNIQNPFESVTTTQFGQQDLKNAIGASNYNSNANNNGHTNLQRMRLNSDISNNTQSDNNI